ncbi:MAG: electron transport complex subunit RsxC [Caldiserica bacterium]|nr:MAG: electron transport complex subunit RsxC [Caldisericota bacterium]
MRKFTFKGGVHLEENKLTKDEPIKKLDYPSLFVIPLLQHIGKPAKPVVNKNDKVLRFQIIAEKEGMISANIHSPVSGKVIDIKKYITCSGEKVESIFIENDGEYKSFEYEKIDPQKVNSKKLLERIAEAGIVGLGGACFPTHVKLSPPHKIDTFIVNACECEPYLTVDHRLLLERTDELIEGIEIVLKILNIKKAIIGIEDNKIDAYEKLSEKLPKNIEIALLKTKYPQGGEKQLIKAILDREVPPGGVPYEVGVVVHNVGTVLAIRDAVYEGKTLVERVFTASGYVRKAGNYIAPIGMKLKDIISQLGGIPEFINKIVIGGPMMGVAISSLEVPFTKSVTGILFLENLKKEEYECIRCSRCVDICPMNLLPTEIYRKVKKKDYINLKNLYPEDCIECGSCSYVCPSKIELIQYIKLAKILAK